MFLANNGKTKKENSKIISQHSIHAFSNPNIIGALPSTELTASKLGAKEEIATMTPTKGTFMGLIMCGGFTPMLTILLTAHFGNGLNIQLILAVCQFV